MQLILTLSHWQATVERGFSVNKEVLAPNLEETSLVAMRLVHNSMQAAKCRVVDFDVNEALLSSCAHARHRYQMYFMERKAEQERTEKGQKKKALMEELTSAKKAKEDLEKVSKKLVNTADKNRTIGPWLIWHHEIQQISRNPVDFMAMKFGRFHEIQRIS